jgi:uncharacterized repeat protein (TIGR01451 family)
VTVKDPLPPALKGFTWTCTATAAPTKCHDASGKGDIDTTVDIAAGGHVTFTISGTVPPGTTVTLANTATVTPPPGTIDPGCDPDCHGTVSPPGVPQVDLSVTKTASPDPYIAGEKLTFTVVVSNGGPSDASGVMVDDPLPPDLAGAGFTWTCTPSAGSSCTANGTGSIHDTATVAAGGTLTYTITGTVPPGTTATLANTAIVTPPPGTTDPGCDACTATVADPPAAGLIIPTDLGQWQPGPPAAPAATALVLITLTGLGLGATAATRRRRTRQAGPRHGRQH